MKSNIHPTYYPEVNISCTCGNSFVAGSTKKEIHVEICYKCHPLYTGEKKYIDTLGQVGKFQKKQQLAKKMQETLTPGGKKNLKKKDIRPKSLRELLTEI